MFLATKSPGCPVPKKPNVRSWFLKYIDIFQQRRLAKNCRPQCFNKIPKATQIFSLETDLEVDSGRPESIANL